VHHALDIFYPDYWWVEWLRYYVIFVGFACLFEAVLVYKKHWSNLMFARRMTVAGFGLFGTFASVQELEQLGQRMLAWRLPSLAIISTFFLVSLYLHLRGRSTIPV
jgi:hypothetical protein